MFKADRKSAKNYGTWLVAEVWKPFWAKLEKLFVNHVDSYWLSSSWHCCQLNQWNKTNCSAVWRYRAYYRTHSELQLLSKNVMWLAFFGSRKGFITFEVKNELFLFHFKNACHISFPCLQWSDCWDATKKKCDWNFW